MTQPIKPTSGWYSGDEIPDYMYEDNAICDYGDMTEEEMEFAEPISILYGDWLQDKDGKYEPNPNGSYAAIYNPNYSEVAVVFSATVKYGILGSPCIPGQVSAHFDDPNEPEGDLVNCVAGQNYAGNWSRMSRKCVPYYAFPDDLYSDFQLKLRKKWNDARKGKNERNIDG